jgi:UDP:flavonoid glycosyltransferase YjiC (YdhE family)
MHRSCLFLINGLGMGNSTRCHAVIEHLHARGIEVHVLTSGNGLKYFADKRELASLTPTEAFFYSTKKGRISGWQTLKSLRALRPIASHKRRQLDEVLDRIRPDVAVLDSEYTVGPLRRRRIPVIGLNNSDVVVSKYLRTPDKPRTIRSHFWTVEFTDYLFHKQMCDLVISPAAEPLPPRHSRIRRVGLILRRALREALPDRPPEFPLPRQIRSMVFMLSGSIHATPIDFGNETFPFHIDVVGRPGLNTRNVTFHGQIMSNLPLLLKADALVVNGGFSAVGEALALRKPTFAIPVPGHAEQYVNARLLPDLGRGYVTDETSVMSLIDRLYRQDCWEGLNTREIVPGIDGAREAAELIWTFMERRPPRAAAPAERT